MGTVDKVLASKMDDWNWKPRFDLDLGQRCLTIILYSWTLRYFLQFFGLGLWLLDFITVLFLFAALCKSSIQYSPDGKAVLVTGCDTGFGFQLAKKLHNDGFKVFAGCLFAEKEGATELRQYGIDVIQLNVTEEKEWDACVDHIQNSKVKLWGLVHNAGWSTFGEVEWIPMKTYRRIADINVFGLMMGTQKILPLIRPNKGRIVTITSGLVCGGAPSRSPYVFTKYAAVGFLECLRYEMRRFGVHVSMLEPGNFLAGTKLFDNEIINRTADDMWQNMASEVKNGYGEDFFNSRKELMKSYNNSGMRDLSPVLEGYSNGLLDVFPQVRYQPANLQFKMRFFAHNHLPESLFEWYYT